MKVFLTYDLSSGVIMQQCWGDAPPGLPPNCAAAEIPAPLEKPSRYRWDLAAGAPVEKDPMPRTVAKRSFAADGVDAGVITGLPNGVEVLWPDGAYTIETDGMVELAVDVPGTYKLRFYCQPYLDAEEELTAL